MHSYHLLSVFTSLRVLQYVEFALSTVVSAE